MSEKRAIAKNTAINFARTVMSYGVRLFTMPIILNALGSSEYGTLVLVGSIMESSTLMQGGLGVPITKYVAEYLAKDDDEGLNRLVNSAFVVFVITGAAIVAVLLAFVLLLMNRVFHIPADLQRPALIYALIAVAVFGVNHVAALFGRLVEGAQRYDIQFRIEVVGLLAGPVATAVVAATGGGIIRIGVVTGSLTAVGLVITIAMALRAAPGFRFDPRLADRGEMKRMLPFSWRVFVTKVSSYLSDRFNPWIVGAFMPVSALTFYNIADRIHQLARMPAAVTSITILPVTSGLDAKNERERVASLYVRAVKYTAAISLPVILAGLVLADPVIRYWLGERFISAVPMTRAYLSYLSIAVMIPVASQVLVGLEKLDKRLTRRILGVTGVNLVVSVLLVRSIGTIGVIWGSVVGGILMWLVLTARVVKELRVSPWRILKDAIIPTFGPAAVVYVPLWFLAGWFAPPNFIVTVLYGAAAMVLYEAAVVAVGFDAGERASLRAYGASLFRRLRGA